MVSEAAERVGPGERASRTSTPALPMAPAAALLLLNVLLWAPLAPTLWGSWRGDDTLAHGPLVPLIAGGMVWSRRRSLRVWNAASAPGLAVLAISALAHVLAVWADINFVAGASLVGMLAGTVWYLGGNSALRVAGGALGFLPFMLPWPTTVIDKIAFPLQMTSSAYAALLGGMLGLPIHREGVHLSIQPNPDASPVYRVMVARQCSGLTSLIVLLALGYLIAYATPVRFGWKALILASVVPLALFANALRLTLILLAGANHGEALATWVHDHEAPVLISLCSLALLGLRAGILAWTARATAKGGRHETAAVMAG